MKKHSKCPRFGGIFLKNYFFSVDIMKRRLDPENLGIILLNSFMDEFFPREDNPMPDLFSLVHYNGLAQSNLDGQVRIDSVFVNLYLRRFSDKIQDRGVRPPGVRPEGGERVEPDANRTTNQVAKYRNPMERTRDTVTQLTKILPFFFAFILFNFYGHIVARK